MKKAYVRNILMTLLGEHPRDLSVGEITRETGYARDTVIKYLDYLVEKGFVEKTRKVGKAQLYAAGPRIQNVVGEEEGGEELNDLLQLAT